MSEAEPEPRQQEQPLIAHLLELRDRLLKIVWGVLLVFLPLMAFAKDIYAWLAQPLLRMLPEGTSMIATEVASPFFTPIKLAALVAFVLAMPWVLYQVWAFVAPGLYKNERRLVVPLLASSTLLFYAGIAFAYFLVLPTVFKFIIGIAPEGVAVMTDIAKYLDFVLALFLAFGFAFETPVALVLMVKTGFVTPAKLGEMREYVLVGAFVVGAIFTPPDIVSQIMLAVPVYLLYELGIVASRILVPGAREVEAQQRQQDSG
ncbi:MULTISPECIES: twin-arginine translocase subunit TatC [Pseudomonadota]|uniref:Sec-independent protein translocase protein TatC n=1 Tax=Sinimarinibacterium flocculans TaxID=985250 RepID=A0A318E2E9_9GAMM|nr:twin-arginine translocase subunit TatC [Sinimarinibacterium flocculans]MEC9363662.1 twin-arginine translocase subunit TatC [Pseudomonadota bacterium]PXV64902.1 Sec-independent protein translocase TatC [Sinimarinibacterium flocculans]